MQLSLWTAWVIPILERIQELREQPIKQRTFNQIRLGTITDKATKTDLKNAIAKLPQTIQASSVFEKDFNLVEFARESKEDYGYRFLRKNKPSLCDHFFQENIFLGQLILEPDKFDENTLKTALTSLTNKYLAISYDLKTLKVIEMIFLLLEEEIDKRKDSTTAAIKATSRNKLENFHNS